MIEILQNDWIAFIKKHICSQNKIHSSNDKPCMEYLQYLALFIYLFIFAGRVMQEEKMSGMWMLTIWKRVIGAGYEMKENRDECLDRIQNMF